MLRADPDSGDEVEPRRLARLTKSARGVDDGRFGNEDQAGPLDELAGTSGVGRSEIACGVQPDGRGADGRRRLDDVRQLVDRPVGVDEFGALRETVDRPRADLIPIGLVGRLGLGALVRNHSKPTPRQRIRHLT